MAESTTVVVSFARARSLGGAALWEYMQGAANATAAALGRQLTSQDYHIGQVTCDREAGFYQGTFPFAPLQERDFSPADFSAPSSVP